MGKICRFTLLFSILVTSEIIVCEDHCSLQEFQVKLYENKIALQQIIDGILEDYCGIIRVEVCKSDSIATFQNVGHTSGQNKLEVMFLSLVLGFIILRYTI